ncbi:HU family DNA-binding protein [Microcoleus asticus]|uniref:DNA-binding protein HU n=1 Tax=Microcoleus asticus IPMA8 TaxID=2563858 RepID=A0ABX2D459_9CYAN|nr:HU family DNA-binding protein [Microcoleus asticus]NQE37291.1 DNA-binding protein HU [Microcoleus asticus IPMA8]
MASVAQNLPFREVISSVISSLGTGESIKIEGFGTFSLIEKPEREGRNPKTGELTIYKPTRRPKITFDKKFLERVYSSGTAPETSTETTSATAPVASPATTLAPAVTPAVTPVAAPTAPVLPPPIPAELLTPSQPPMLWQIKAPDNSFVEVPSNELPNWGVGANTPIYSAATGWKLAGQVPELVGIVK